MNTFFILCQLFFCYAIFDNHVDSTFLFAIQTCITIMEKAVLTLILNCHETCSFSVCPFLYKKAIIQGIKKLDYFSIYRVQEKYLFSSILSTFLEQSFVLFLDTFYCKLSQTCVSVACSVMHDSTHFVLTTSCQKTQTEVFTVSNFCT